MRDSFCTQIFDHALKPARSFAAQFRVRQPNLENRAMTTTRNVKDLMNPHIMTVADEMTTDELARYLIEREISGAPVVDNRVTSSEWCR